MFFGAVRPYTPVQSGGGGFLPAGHFVTSALPLTIIAPFAGLSTTNRYYKQYPGIPYIAPVVAYGGAWPYVFTLTSAPSGMTVGQTFSSANYGTITWNNPIAGTYTCTVQVQDQNLNSVSSTWTLTVTTTGFIFVDSINGSHSVPNGGTGTGSISAPFLTLDDWYSGAAGSSGTPSARKADSTYSNFFVYYRQGSYTTVAIEGADNGNRMPLTNNAKPKIHLGYPGETATIDTTNAAIIIYGDAGQGPWFGGLSASGMASTGDYKWVEWDAGCHDTGFFQNNYNNPGTVGAQGANPAFMMSRANAPSISTRGFVSGCTFANTLNHDYMLGYATSIWVFENNVMTGVNDATGFYAKGDGSHPTQGGNDTWTVRNNTCLAANTGRSLVSMDGYAYATNMDICWNNYATGSGGTGLYFGPDTGGNVISGIYSYRNTWQISSHVIDTVPVTSWTVINDVTPFTNGSANSHAYILAASGGSSGSLASGSFSGEECVGLNINCVTPSSGNLTGSFRTNFLGLRGHEIA